MAGIRKIKELFKSRGVDKSIYLSTFILAVFGIIMIGSASVGSVTRYGVTYALKNMIIFIRNFPNAYLYFLE